MSKRRQRGCPTLPSKRPGEKIRNSSCSENSINKMGIIPLAYPPVHQCHAPRPPHRFKKRFRQSALRSIKTFSSMSNLDARVPPSMPKSTILTVPFLLSSWIVLMRPWESPGEGRAWASKPSRISSFLISCRQTTVLSSSSSSSQTLHTFACINRKHEHEGHAILFAPKKCSFESARASPYPYPLYVRILALELLFCHHHQGTITLDAGLLCENYSNSKAVPFHLKSEMAEKENDIFELSLLLDSLNITYGIESNDWNITIK